MPFLQRDSSIPNTVRLCGVFSTRPLSHYAFCVFLVGYDRDPAYTPERLPDRNYPWGLTPINGYIDQVRQTFSYLDGSYPFINEKQVA